MLGFDMETYSYDKDPNYCQLLFRLHLIINIAFFFCLFFPVGLTHVQFIFNWFMSVSH